MNGDFAGGLATAFGAAVLYGCAPIAQALAARRTRGGGLGLALTLRLAREPVWLFGLGCEVGAFVLEAFAYSMAPTTLVAPVTACEMLVFVLAAWASFGQAPSRTGSVGALVLACALAVLAISFDGSTDLGSPASSATLLAFLCSCAVLCGVVALLGSRVLRAGRRVVATGLFATASGVAYGFATLTTRQVGETFVPDRPWNLLATPTPYVLGGCSALGIVLMQRGLQINATYAFPLASAVSAFLPVAVGAAVLGDGVPPGSRTVSFVLALVLLVAGVVLLSQDRIAQETVVEHERARDGARK